jgi:hypothetical protein
MWRSGCNNRLLRKRSRVGFPHSANICFGVSIYNMYLQKKVYTYVFIRYLESITQALQILTLDWSRECKCLEYLFIINQRQVLSGYLGSLVVGQHGMQQVGAQRQQATTSQQMRQQQWRGTAHAASHSYQCRPPTPRASLQRLAAHSIYRVPTRPDSCSLHHQPINRFSAESILADFCASWMYKGEEDEELDSPAVSALGVRSRKLSNALNGQSWYG